MLQTRDLPKVRDCPFCGDRPSFLTLTDYSTQWVVQCKSLDCMVKPATGPAVSAAVAANRWNVRHTKTKETGHD